MGVVTDAMFNCHAKIIFPLPLDNVNNDEGQLGQRELGGDQYNANKTNQDDSNT